jgi:hypothetical protein
MQRPSSKAESGTVCGKNIASSPSAQTDNSATKHALREPRNTLDTEERAVRLKEVGIRSRKLQAKNYVEFIKFDE